MLVVWGVAVIWYTSVDNSKKKLFGTEPVDKAIQNFKSPYQKREEKTKILNGRK